MIILFYFSTLLHFLKVILEFYFSSCVFARHISRSHTAERIARSWTFAFTHNHSREISCFGTPPHEVVVFSTEIDRGDAGSWIHSLKRARSDDRIQLVRLYQFLVYSSIYFLFCSSTV